MQHSNVMFDIVLHPFVSKSTTKLAYHAQSQNEDRNATNATAHIVCSMKVALPRRKVGTLNVSIVHGHVVVFRGDYMDTSICNNKTRPMPLSVSDLRGEATVTVLGPAKQMKVTILVVQEKVREVQ